jgi:hypothetical protein
MGPLRAVADGDVAITILAKISRAVIPYFENSNSGRGNLPIENGRSGSLLSVKRQNPLSPFNNGINWPRDPLDLGRKDGSWVHVPVGVRLADSVE